LVVWETVLRYASITSRKAKYIEMHAMKDRFGFLTFNAFELRVHNFYDDEEEDGIKQAIEKGT
jgi:hypothetical protein